MRDLRWVYRSGLGRVRPGSYNLMSESWGMCVRSGLFIIICCVLSAGAYAEPDLAGADLPEPQRRAEPVHPGLQLEWNNSRPEQREALDHFYRSLERAPDRQQSARQLEREEHLQRLRSMSPEQRQQHFTNFQKQLPPPPPPPPVR